VLFSPQSYYYYAAQDGHAGKPQAAIRGVCRALVRNSIPFTVVEEEHLETLAGMRVLYLPRATALTQKTKDTLLAFVREGGILVAESECGAFDETGIYSYPDERFLAREADICEIGRRQLINPTLRVKLDGQTVDIKATQWTTPLLDNASGQTTFSSDPDGALLAMQPLGRGKIIYFASYPSDAYCVENNTGFEEYLKWIAGLADCKALVEVLAPQPTLDSFLYIKMGRSGDRRLLFVFFPEDQESAHLRFRTGVFHSRVLVDIITGTEHNVIGQPGQPTELVLERPDLHFAVLFEADDDFPPKE